jgi:ABC-type lipoprotein release transport system permease subunit
VFFLKRSTILLFFLLGILLLYIPDYSYGRHLNSIHPIFINQALKDDLSLKKGNIIKLSAHPQGPWSSFRIAGYKESRFDPLNLYYTNQAVTMNLSDLWRLTGKKGDVSFIALKLKNKKDFKKVSQGVSLLGLHLENPKRSEEQGTALSLIFERFSSIIAWLSFGAGTIFLFSLMLLKTEEEKKEMGYLQAIGIGKKTISKLLMLDGLFLSILGTLFGLFLGTLAGLAINFIFQWYFQRPGTKFAIFSENIYWELLILGMLMGFLSTLFSLARVKIVKIAKLFENP